MQHGQRVSVTEASLTDEVMAEIQLVVAGNSKDGSDRTLTVE